MRLSDYSQQPVFFVRRGALLPWEDIRSTQVVRLDLFKKIIGEEHIPFTVYSLKLANDRIVLAVDHPDHLPFLDEVLETLEVINAQAH